MHHYNPKQIQQINSNHDSTRWIIYEQNNKISNKQKNYISKLNKSLKLKRPNYIVDNSKNNNKNIKITSHPLHGNSFYCLYP